MLSGSLNIITSSEGTIYEMIKMQIHIFATTADVRGIF